jgi:hypothetical protein
VIEDVDESLRVTLQSLLADDVDVTFDAPRAVDVGEPSHPAELNLFLFHIEADASALGSAFVDVRDEQGRVVGREKPPRQYRLHYLVSVSGSNTTGEHQLLGRVVTTLGELQALPPGDLQGALVDTGSAVTVRLAEKDSGRNVFDLWSAFGVRPRGCFELVATVTVRSDSVLGVSPKVEQVVLNATASPHSSSAGEPLEQRKSVPVGGAGRPRMEGRVRHLPRRS